MKAITVKSGQSILDIAIVYTGDVKTSFNIAVMNDNAITDELLTGQVLNIPDVINENIVALFNDKNQPATDLIEQIDNPESGGIGYMEIGRNFKVS